MKLVRGVIIGTALALVMWACIGLAIYLGVT